MEATRGMAAPASAKGGARSDVSGRSHATAAGGAGPGTAGESGQRSATTFKAESKRIRALEAELAALRSRTSRRLSVGDAEELDAAKAAATSEGDTDAEGGKRRSRKEGKPRGGAGGMAIAPPERPQLPKGGKTPADLLEYLRAYKTYAENATALGAVPVPLRPQLVGWATGVLRTIEAPAESWDDVDELIESCVADGAGGRIIALPPTLPTQPDLLAFYGALSLWVADVATWAHASGDSATTARAVRADITRVAPYAMEQLVHDAGNEAVDAMDATELAHAILRVFLPMSRPEQVKMMRMATLMRTHTDKGPRRKSSERGGGGGERDTTTRPTTSTAPAREPGKHPSKHKHDRRPPADKPGAPFARRTDVDTDTRATAPPKGGSGAGKPPAGTGTAGAGKPAAKAPGVGLVTEAHNTSGDSTPTASTAPTTTEAGAWVAPATDADTWTATISAAGAAQTTTASVMWDSGNKARALISPSMADALRKQGALLEPAGVKLHGALPGAAPVDVTTTVTATLAWRLRRDGVATTMETTIRNAAVVDTRGFGADIVLPTDDPKGLETFAALKGAMAGNLHVYVPPGGTIPPGARTVDTEPPAVTLQSLMPNAVTRAAAFRDALDVPDRLRDQLILPGAESAEAPSLATTLKFHPDTTVDQRNAIASVVAKYPAIYSEPIPRAPAAIMSLGMPDTVPPDKQGQRLRARIKPGDMQAAQQQVDTLVAATVLQEVSTDEARTLFFSPLIMAGTGEKQRLVVDLRAANAHAAHRDQWTTSVQSKLHQLRPRRYRICLDISKAYLSVGVTAQDQQWLGVALGTRSYKFTRCPFGHVNAGAAFETVLARILPRDLDAQVMVDDITIDAETMEELLAKLDRLLAIFDANNIRIGLHKLQFLPPTANATSTLSYLGFRVGSETREMDARTTAPVAEALLPTTTKQWRAFTGAANAIASVVPGMAERLRPLHALTSKGATGKASAEQVAAFEAVKAAARRPVTLHLIDPGTPLDIKVDASKDAIGVYVTQANRLVGIFQRAFTDAELALSAVDKEAVALLYAVHQCGDLLRRLPATVHTDARNLVVLDDTTNPKMQRVAAQLMQFPHLRIQHIDGVRNVEADSISRMRVAGIHSGPAAAGAGAGPPGVEHAEAARPTLLEAVAAAQQAMTKADKASIKADGPTLWTTRAGVKVLEREGRLLIPPSAKTLQERLLNAAHDARGHPALTRTVRNMRNDGVWWRTMVSDAKAYIASCTTCTRESAPRGASKNTELLPWPLPAHPGEVVSGDYMSLPDSVVGGYKYVLVLLDELTGWTRLFAFKEATGATTVDALKQWVEELGYPETFRTDGGSHFNCDLVNTYCTSHGIRHHIGVPYAPWTMAKNERSHAEIRKRLQGVLGGAVGFWPRELRRVEELYNTAENESMGMSPFKALHGFDKRMVTAAELHHTRRGGLARREDWLDTIKEIQQLARTRQEEAARDRKAAYDKDVKRVDFKVGDYVLRYSPTLTNSLGYHYNELQEVVEVLPERNTCMVRSVVMGTISDVHMNHLRRVNLARSSPAREAEKELPPTHLIVEEIQAHRARRDGGLELLVRWRLNEHLDWAPTWEKAEDLTKVTKARDYLAAHDLDGGAADKPRAGKGRGGKR
jgi:hypothetical protein